MVLNQSLRGQSGLTLRICWTPYRVKIHKSGKEGFGVQKPSSPSLWTWCSESNNPHTMELQPSCQARFALSGPVLPDTARLSQRYPRCLRAMGFLVSQHDQSGAIPPPPFLSLSPLESMRSGCAIPPASGASQRYLRDTT